MQPNDAFWKRKLMAFLHDPPCKCFDIRGHEERAKSFLATAGITAEEFAEFVKSCDATAAAADRFPFPDSRKSGLKSAFDGTTKTPFKHPLGRAQYATKAALPTADLAEELLQVSVGGVYPELDWKSKFFLYWRRWPEESSRRDARLAYLPADTRLPDHTIWNHMSLTSALQGCVPAGSTSIDAAFLMFQFGPVQEFISSARRTRDYLAGSYILGWLAAHALKAVAERCGPDAVIFPSLRGQPIFDALYREELYEQVRYGDDSLWTRMGYTRAQLLSPTLTNRFLALVPAAEGEAIAQAATDSLHAAWKEIGDECWNGFAKLATQAGVDPLRSWRTRWDGQTKDYWQIAWQTWPWRSDVAIDENLQQVITLATRTIPAEHRDQRYFEQKDVNRDLTNIGLLWPAQYAAAAKLLAARRNTREFPQFFTDGVDSDQRPERTQIGARKDVLTGKEEVIGSEALWARLQQSGGDVFKVNEGPYGAPQIIKRLLLRDQPVDFLARRLGRKTVCQGLFDSVEDVAANNKDASPYVAVLAMDGDRMGQFMSGEKLPPLTEQLSHGARQYMEGLDGAAAGIRRPLSPSYHLQFSEALSNFATCLAGRTVEAFGGQLIYSGGDDVLAMLPADKALACAVALRACFRGESPPILKEDAEFAFGFQTFLEVVEFDQPGWVTPRGIPQPYPLMVPGPATDVSCGIAYAHSHYPLQALIREAQAAETRAKHEYGRGAVAVSLLKRGGETVHWGCKWGQERQTPLALYHRFISWRHENKITGRFAYALAELIAPYRLGADAPSEDLDIKAILKRELETPLERQCCDAEVRQRLRTRCHAYLDELENGYLDEEGRQTDQADHNVSLPGPPWQDFVKLFLVATFIDRGREEY